MHDSLMSLDTRSREVSYHLKMIDIARMTARSTAAGNQLVKTRAVCIVSFHNALHVRITLTDSHVEYRDIFYSNTACGEMLHRSLNNHDIRFY